MRKIISVLVIMAAMFVGGTAMAQGNMKDVVHLKNGGVVKGLIIEQVPGQSIKIQTADGSIFVYQMKDIEKMTKEASNTLNNGTGAQVKNPTAAWALSFFIPGAGQIYNEQVGKGIAMLLAYPVVVGVGIGLAEATDGVSGLVGLAAGLGVWIWSQIDAYSTAKRINAQGFAFDLGGDRHLYLRPEMSVVDIPMASNGKVVSTGMNLSFSF